MEGMTVYDLDGDIWIEMNPLNGLPGALRSIRPGTCFNDWPFIIPRVGSSRFDTIHIDKERRQCFRDQFECCPYCGRDMVLTWIKSHPLAATVDHMQPKSLGGTDNHRNKVLACQRCNNRKGSKALIVFLAQMRPAHPDWVPYHQTAAD